MGPTKNSKFSRILCVLIGLLAQSVCPPAQAAAKENSKSPFIAVFVDDATEAVLGPFPYDRSKYAQVLSALRKAKAKAVIIKYFLDQAKPGKGDDELAAELAKMPALLQARLDPSEKKPNPLPVRFVCGRKVQGDTQKLLSAQSGWIPLKKFNRRCAGVGFVDLVSRDDVLDIPMVVKYQDRLVPSLDLIALELAFNVPASIVLGGQMSLAGHHLTLDAAGQVHAQLHAMDEVDTISFIDVLNGRFDKGRIEGKIVVLGFDAKETPTLPTPLGPMRIHSLFFLSLESLYRQLESH